jgi:spermidine synthase
MRAVPLVSERAGVRLLHFGSRFIQGAMRLQRPYSLELDYTREMMLPLALAGDPAWPRSVLMVGLGAASQLRFLWRHRPRASFTVLEIDERVIALARHAFKLPDDERLSLVVGDAVATLPSLGAAFDGILLDGFDARGNAGKLEAASFYAACRDRLAPGGFLAVNRLSRSRGVAPSVARLVSAFDDRVLVLPPCKSGNTVAVARRAGGSALAPREWAAGALALKQSTGLDLRVTVRSLDPAAAARLAS